MVINEQQKFIFIHVFRTGGCSVEQALGGRSERYDTHEKLEDIPNWQKYTTFAFVRNPWDRMVSAFMYATIRRQLSQNIKTFEDYVRQFSQPPLNTRKQFAQYEMVKNCNFVGRFEHLKSDYNLVCDHLGFTTGFPHLWKTNHAHYSEYYTDELRDIVHDASRGDIEHFGFTFDGTAIKNVGWVR